MRLHASNRISKRREFIPLIDRQVVAAATLVGGDRLRRVEIRVKRRVLLSPLLASSLCSLEFQIVDFSVLNLEFTSGLQKRTAECRGSTECAASDESRNGRGHPRTLPRRITSSL